VARSDGVALTRYKLPRPLGTPSYERELGKLSPQHLHQYAIFLIAI
jgi:hypothetical protein